jgi:hypothetical protein
MSNRTLASPDVIATVEIPQVSMAQMVEHRRRAANVVPCAGCGTSVDPRCEGHVHGDGTVICAPCSDGRTYRARLAASPKVCGCTRCLCDNDVPPSTDDVRRTVCDDCDVRCDHEGHNCNEEGCGGGGIS